MSKGGRLRAQCVVVLASTVQILLWSLPIALSGLLMISALIGGRFVELFLQVFVLYVARIVYVYYWALLKSRWVRLLLGAPFSVKASLLPNMYGHNISFFMRTQPLEGQTVRVWFIHGAVGIVIHEYVWKLATDEELRAVLAHEMGHVRARDLTMRHLMSIWRITLIFMALSLLFAPQLHLLWWFMFAYFTVTSTDIIAFCELIICEIRADALAVLSVGAPDALATALIKVIWVNGCSPEWLDRFRIRLLASYQ